MIRRLLPYAGLSLAAWLLWRSRPLPDLSGQVALITGGSRGLGLEIARQLGSRGVRLALVARDHTELGRAALELNSLGFETSVWSYDITDETQTTEMVERILAHYGRIDILINNAGQITVGPFELFTSEDFERALAVHLLAPLRLIQAVLPNMKKNRGGRIVNIASIGGKIGVPHLSPYCASKFALVGLSKTLRAELAAYGISLTTVCPGLMRTGSHWNARFKGRREKEFAWFAHGASLPGVSMPSRRAASQIVAALARRQTELIISAQAQAAVLADAAAPGLVARISSLVSYFLPGIPENGGRKSKSGWHARSKWAPSLLTRLGDAAAINNNELGGRTLPVE